MQVTTGDVTITIEDGRLKVQSPYHPEFVAVARGRNGRWSAPHWIFDARDEASIRDECRRIYGTDGTPVPCVDCRVEYDEYRYFSGLALYALGRLLVERRSRDERVRMGPGVVAIAGGFPSSGGSVKSPDPKGAAGTILEVRDVPTELARRWVAEKPGVTIIEPEAVESAAPSPLIGFSAADLATELARRGWTCTAPEGDHS